MLARRSHLTILDSITKLSGEGGGWQPASDVTFTKQKLSFNTINVKQEGYLFAYLSYDNDSNNWVYFDDFKVTHTPTNVLQYNEYYPFGLQTSNSWTRENSSNDYLYNAGNELNGNSGWYETFFRGYDPVLGRFLQADPLAYASSSHTPYSYAFNDPVYYNDPMGDYPREVAIRMGINRRGGGCYDCGAGDGFSDGGMFGGSGESKPWYRVQPGSGNNWMDSYGFQVGGPGYGERNAAAWVSELYGIDNARAGVTYSRESYYEVDYSTENLNGETWTGASVVSGERWVQTQNGPIKMTVGNTATGSAYVRGYPNDVRDGQGRGIVYQVPTYDLTVSGTDAKGNAVSKTFTVLRYGVYNNANGPSVVGVNDGTYALSWGNMSRLGRALHVDGAGRGMVWVHAGPIHLDRPIGAIGCVELCGPGSWTSFTSFLGGLGSGPMTITFMPATPPPLQQVPGIRY